MILNNKYLKRKKGVRDIEVTIINEKYFVNPNMLPFIAARVYKNNKLYAFIVVNKRGVPQLLRPGDTLAIIQAISFINAKSKDDLINKEDIPSCMLDDNDEYKPMKIQAIDLKKTLVVDEKKVLVNNEINKPGVRQERNFKYSNEAETGMSLGYQKGFSMQAELPEELFPVIESKYNEIKNKFGDKFNVQLKVIERKIDKDNNKATVVFTIEGEIANAEWRIIGTIYYNEDKTIVKPMVTVSRQLLDKMYSLTCKCDICGENRDRNKTYYLQNLKDKNKFIQAAGHCMNKTIGVKELASAIAFEELLQLLRPEEANKYRDLGLSYYNTIDLLTVLYTSGSYNTTEKDDFNFRVGAYEYAKEEDKKFINGLIEWVKGLDDGVESFRAVKVLLTCTTVHKRFISNLKRIIRRYEIYLNNKKKLYPQLIKSFEDYRNEIEHNIEYYNIKLENYRAYNNELRKKVEEEVNTRLEEIKTNNAKKKEVYDKEIKRYNDEYAKAKDEYERRLGAYNEYQIAKISLSEAEKIELEKKIANKYNIQSVSMKEFNSATWIKVKVKSVYLKLIRDNQFGSGKAGPYVFETDEGFYISWYTSLDNAKELGLPQELGVKLELNKVLRCKTKQMYYDELQVTYCKFVDSSYESLRDSANLFNEEPKMRYIKKPVEPQYEDEEISMNNFISYGNGYKNIKDLKLNSEVENLIYSHIKNIDATEFYNNKYVSIQELYKQFIRTFKKSIDKESVKNDRIKIESVIVLDIVKDAYTIIYKADKLYMIKKVRFKDDLKKSMLLRGASEMIGVEIPVDNKICIECKVLEAKVNELGDKLYMIDGNETLYIDENKLEFNNMTLWRYEDAE